MRVGEVYCTGVLEAVYNLRVAGHHTYFVGDDGWGWAAWAHNTYDFPSGLKVAEVAAEQYKKERREFTVADRTAIIAKVRDTGEYGAVGDLQKLTQEFAVAKPGETALQVLQAYLSRGCVGQARRDLEAEINSRTEVANIEAEGDTDNLTVRGWTAYIHLTYGVDALGKTYQEYQASKPAGAAKTHGHHIVYKKGSEGAANTASKEAKDILLYRGIDPYFGKENLVYAPNQGHSAAVMQYILQNLKTPNGNPKSRTAIVSVLQQMAIAYINQKLPGMANWGGNP